jgi:hypothetical protein
MIEDTGLGGGPVETGAPKVKALKGKGTTTVTLDFDESDDDVFDEEAKNARASRLSESTIDVNTGEKVVCHLEKGVSISNFFAFIFDFEYLTNSCFVFVQRNFSGLFVL